MVLTVEVDLEGAPPGARLDPPASLHVNAVMDPVDSAFSIGVSRDVTVAGPVELDVRSVVSEVGRLGRAPEMIIWLHQPGARPAARTILLMDIEGLLTGRKALRAVAFSLRPTTRVVGRIRRASGTNVSGGAVRASVRAYRMSGSEPLPEAVHAVGVDEDGTFEIRLAGEGRFLLVAVVAPWSEYERRQGHLIPPQGRLVDIKRGSALDPMDFQLQDGAWVEGEVVHPATGDVEGEGLVRWRLVDDALLLEERRPELAFVDGEVVWARGEARVSGGAFRVQGMPPRACDFSVAALEGVCLAEPVGETRRGPGESRVTLVPACAALQLNPHAEGDSPPPSTWLVRVRTMDDDAESWIREVSPGSKLLVSPGSTYRIETYDARYAPSSIRVTAGAAGTTTTVAVPLTPMTRSTLVVHLHLPDGSPYSGWAAFALAEPGSPQEAPDVVWSSALHGRDGRYRLEGVPDGRWRLHLRAGRSTFWGRPAGYLERTADVVTPPRSEPEATLQVDLGARLVIRVADRDGKPRAGRVRIQARGGAAVPAVFVSDFFDFDQAEVRGAPGELPAADTLWLATALEPGTYDVHIVPDGGSATVHTLHLDADETEAISITAD